MGPTRAWQEPPAKHGFATDRERLLWQHGWDAVMALPPWRLAQAAGAFMHAAGLLPQVEAARAELPDHAWVYPLLAGMARAVGDRDWRR